MRHIRKIAFLLCALVAIPACSQSAPSVEIQPIDGEDQAYLRELWQGMVEVANVASFFCVKVYPRPTPAECLDRIKHGVGNSFDPHSAYMSKNELEEFKNETSGAGFVGIGIEIAKPSPTSPILVVSAIEGTPAEKAGILADDLIMAVSNDGQSFVLTSALKNDAAAVQLIRGELGTTVTLRVRRIGVEKELIFSVRRDTIKIAQVRGELLRVGNKTYALIQNKVYREGNAVALKAKYKELSAEAGGKLSGLILSSENNPGGLLGEVIGGVDLFLDADSIVLQRDNRKISPYEDPRALKTVGDITGGLPILVVVNSGCASACEVFAGNMQFHHRALVAGTSASTFGKGIVQTVRDGPSGSALKYTSSEYLIGSMTNWIPVQCIGIKPDVLFDYPGVEEQKRISECELSAHVLSGGPMPNAPARRSFEEVNPAHYKAGLEMLDAYRAYMLPRVQKAEARRRATIESQKQE